MTKEQLEFYLNRNNTFGYNTRNDDQQVGWILLFKRFTKPKFFDLVSGEEDPRGYRLQRRIEQEPYWVRIEEVTRAVFESDKYAQEEDYLMKAYYSFRTLDDVELFLKELGHNLAEIKWVQISIFCKNTLDSGPPPAGSIKSGYFVILFDGKSGKN